MDTKLDKFFLIQFSREFFLKKVKEGINQYLLSLNGIEQLKKNLDKNIVIINSPR